MAEYLRFRDLAVGEHFVFVYNVYTNPHAGTETLIKVNNHGWYRKIDAPKRAWHTGTGVTVLRVQHIETKG